MITQDFIEDPTGEFPTVNVATNAFYADEIQIHQGPAGSSEVATLQNDMERDVLSIGKEQALALAYKLISICE